MNAIQTPQSAALAPLSIKDSVLAQFKEVEPSLIDLAARYRDVAYDVTTPKGMKDAVAARADLRDNGRLLLTRAETRIKKEVNDLKRVMSDEVDRLVAIVKPVEDSIDAQIKAEETRKAAEKAERERLEAERVAKHQASIDKLKSYVARAEGQPLEAIERAVRVLSELVIGAEWEEFAGAAEAARQATVESLNKMAGAERLRLENERQAAALAAERAELEQLRASLQAQQQAAERAELESRIPAYEEALHKPELGQEAVAAAEPEAATVEPAASAPRPLARVIPAAQQAPASEEGDGYASPVATLTLGQIGAILGFSLPAAFLQTLGFEPLGRERGAVLYRESDLPLICDTLIERIGRVRATAVKAA